MSFRRPEIDALRVMGTLAVFLFHSLQPFNPHENWHITNAVRSPTAGFFIWFLNLWMMPLFMFLGGCSAYFSLKKRGAVGFLRERFYRIGLPLVLGTLLWVPPQVYFERLQRHQFEGSLVDFWPHFFDGVYPAGNFSWHHLWFLAYLLAYSMVGLPVMRVLARKSSQEKLATFLARSTGLGLLLVFAIPLAVGRILLATNFPITNNFVSDWMWHSQLFLYFMYGFLFAEIAIIEDKLRFDWKKLIGAALFGTVLLQGLPLSADSHYPASLAVYAMLRQTIRAFTDLAWILGILGFAYGFGPRMMAWPIAREFNRIGYPFYIWHQTFIVAVAYYVTATDVSLATKWLTIALAAFAATFAASEISSFQIQSLKKRWPRLAVNS